MRTAASVSRGPEDGRDQSSGPVGGTAAAGSVRRTGAENCRTSERGHDSDPDLHSRGW